MEEEVKPTYHMEGKQWSDDSISYTTHITVHIQNSF